MSYLAYAPRTLRQFVELFWAIDGSDPPRRDRVLPHGCAEVVVSLGADLLPVFDRGNRDIPRSRHGSLIVGPHSEYLMAEIGVPEATIGVAFKPGGAFPFMATPMSAGHNRVEPLDSLWGSFVDDLREDLLKAETPPARFGVLEQYLLARAVRPLSLHPAVGYGLRQFQRVPQALGVLDVAERIGMSHRRFSQLFHDQVGMTPKLFCRIQRFQYALRLIGKSRHPVDWSNITLSCGYFDQAHLIHDFRAFTGLSPSEYVAFHGEFPNHVSV